MSRDQASGAQPPAQAGQLPRFFNRDGTNNVVRIGQRASPLSDLHHYVLRARWRTFIGLIVVLYVVMNALFGLLYMIDGGVENARAGSFADFFFFSVHTMMTIGYGTLAPKSVVANLLVAVEALMGLIGFAMITGLSFNKFSLPTARVLFSRVAVIAMRDGLPSLMFRMANERTNQVVEATLHVVLAMNETTLEGERVRRFYDLKLARERSAIFALSWTAIHPIDRDSRLHGETVETLSAKRAEVIVSLVGIDQTSSQTIHARHSYTPQEMRWGMRFVDVLAPLPDGTPSIDLTKFHDVQRDERSAGQPG